MKRPFNPTTVRMIQHEYAALKRRVAELEGLLHRQQQHIMRLNTMGNFLQSCQSLDDVYANVGPLLAELFSEQAGVLYVFRSDTTLEAVARWGKVLLSSSEMFLPDCYALRHQKIHLTEDPKHDLCCNHLDLLSLPSLCIPLVSRDATLGVLSFHYAPHQTDPAHGWWEQLAVMVARQIATVLTNLRLRDQLQQQAIRDALTGLYNRRYLSETMQRELRRASRYRQPIGIIMLDIDHFKRFNELYGHDGGDTLLSAVGTLLRTSIREEDIACRYGGEEFILLLPGATLEATRVRAELVRQSIKHLRIEHKGKPLGTVTASLGIAIFPDHGATSETLLKAVDEALYGAKNQGRNRVAMIE
ncbi:MAG: sensor domain-containing diguanylate cyclase [Chloroflexaceae bacterium]|nr:sensor domain-containing diguanylate cyclase [Chloroflexaceae bacterium]